MAMRTVKISDQISITYHHKNGRQLVADGCFALSVNKITSSDLYEAAIMNNQKANYKLGEVSLHECGGHRLSVSSTTHVY